MNFNQVLLQTFESDVEELELEKAELTYYPGFDGEIVEKFPEYKLNKSSTVIIYKHLLLIQ